MDKIRRNGHENYIVPPSESAIRQGIAGRVIAVITVKYPGWVEVETVDGRKGQGHFEEMLPNGLAQAIT
jgi:hypothetical protein